MRLFEVHTNADGTTTRKQVSLTLNEWQQQANLVQRCTTDFFAQPVALPDSFKIDTQDTWRLTAAGRPDLDQNLLHGAPPEQIGNINTAFLRTLGHKRLTAALLPPPPPLPADMVDDNALDLDALHTAAPIGIRNMTGKDCFISAFLQAFVFTNPELIKKLWEQRIDGSKDAEIGRFLHRYQQAQRQPDGSDGKKPAVEGVHELRNAIVRTRETTTECLTGEHDPTEVFDFIVNLLDEPIEQQDLAMKGYIQVVPKDNESLEECINRSLAEHNPKKPLPQHAMVINNTKDAFASVVGVLGDYDLTSFIQHTAADGGHYTAYVKKPDGTCYKCSDSTVEKIDPVKFLEEAKTARAALYTRVR